MGKLQISLIVGKDQGKTWDFYNIKEVIHG